MEKDKLIKNNIIDLGSINVPTSWDDVSLKKFSEIERYYNSVSGDSKFNIIDVLHILIDKDVDFINALPIAFTESIMEKLMFLQEKPQEKEPSNKVEIDGVEYKVNIQDKLKTGEYIALDTVLKGDKHNYAAMLAVMCRKDGELYDSKFENEILGDRIKMWEKVPVVKVMPIVAFFLSLWVVLQKNTQLSSMVEEAINLERKNIETLHKDGVLPKRSMKSAMKKLKKLEKSIKCI